MLFLFFAELCSADYDMVLQITSHLPDYLIAPQLFFFLVISYWFAFLLSLICFFFHLNKLKKKFCVQVMIGTQTTCFIPTDFLYPNQLSFGDLHRKKEIRDSYVFLPFPFNRVILRGKLIMIFWKTSYSVFFTYFLFARHNTAKLFSRIR